MAHIDFKPNEIGSFFNLWSLISDNISLLESYPDQSILKLKDSKAPEIKIKIKDKQLTIADLDNYYQPFLKIREAIIDGSISNIERLAKTATSAWPNGSKISETFKGAFNSWHTFYQNPETVKKTKNVIAVLKQEYAKPEYQKVLDGMCTFFGMDLDTVIPARVCLYPFKKNFCNGFGYGSGIWLNYTCEQNEPKENYLFGTVCQKRRLGCPMHESTHFFQRNSQIWQELLTSARPELKRTIDVFTAYFEDNPDKQRSRHITPSAAARDLIDETFASCPGVTVAEKQGEPFPPKEWYSGYETVNKLAPQVYPLFKEYVEKGKKMDDAFFKRLNTNLKGFERRNTSTAYLLSGFNNSR